MKCPCHSQNEYEVCCQSFHEGQKPPTALALMRSRYSAYALSKADYIIETTHPKHIDSPLPRSKKEEQIKKFIKNTLFEDLKILNFEEKGNEAFVTFRAILKREGKDISFTEKSRFLKEGEQWLYVSGEISR